jgi:hypothetical protein
MSFDPNLPLNGSLIRAAELRGQLNGLKELIDAGGGGGLLDDVTLGAIPKKTGDDALGDSALSEDGSNVVVQGKLLSVRRSDGPDAVLLEVHNGSEAVLHIRISGDGSRIVFASNRSGFSFQTAVDVNGAPLAMKPVSVGPFMGTISDPPTQAEMQAVVGWVETLRAAL